MRRDRNNLLAVAAVAGSLVIGGCSHVELAQISGKVQDNHGAPVDRGVIHFDPADGNGPTAEGVITAGHYEVSLVPGNKSVSIQAFKTIGRVHVGGPDGPETDKTVQILPDKYSNPKKTVLKRDIPTSAADVDFVVDASPAPTAKSK